MVMKATAVINAAIAKHYGESPELVASLLGAFHQGLAFELLTESGALDSFSALVELVESNGEHGLKEGRAAIAKVYGSAP
jgi:hypothetical protein